MRDTMPTVPHTFEWVWILLQGVLLVVWGSSFLSSWLTQHHF